MVFSDIFADRLRAPVAVAGNDVVSRGRSFARRARWRLVGASRGLPHGPSEIVAENEDQLNEEDGQDARNENP